MADFISLKEIESTDSAEVVKLKKRFNSIATSLNTLSQSKGTLSDKKHLKLISELYVAAQTIDEFSKS
jgi:hypothetical protein